MMELFKDTIKKVKTETQEKCTALVPKISAIESMAQTMEKLIDNVLEEIEESHQQMFKVLESVAVLEQEKSSFKFGRGTQGSSNENSSLDSSFSGFEYSASKKLDSTNENDGDFLAN